MASREAGDVPEKRVVAGKITTVHGVKGWLKIHSYTVPEENIFDYQPWWMKFPEGWRKLDIDQFRVVDKGFIAHIRNLDDREQARLYCQRDIEVSPENFPEPAPDEVYWHQLEGLKVISSFGGNVAVLGIVDGFMETGANDVIMVKPCEGSIDTQARLIPYVDQFVLSVDLKTGVVNVDWDPDFEKS